MHVLHLLSALDADGSRAVSSLIAEQREHGDIVSLVKVEDREPLHQSPTEAASTSHGPISSAAPFDLVHAHGTNAVAAAARYVAATRPPTPLLVSLHDWTTAGSQPVDEGGAAQLARADLVAVPTEPAAAVVAARFSVDPSRIRVIPHAVSPDQAHTSGDDGPLHHELGAWRTRGGDVVCAVSGGNPSDRARHHEIVLQALSYLAQAESLLCVLAGHVDAEACQRTSAALGLAERIRLSETPVSARRIAARCDYLILPGFDERRPFSLAEAWCDGVPVVAARNARFADLDAHGHGTVFYAPDDALDLARGIATLRDTTPASRRLLVERGRAQYRRHFSPKAVYATYAAACNAIVHRDAARTRDRGRHS